MPAFTLWNAPLGGQYRGADSSNASPLADSPPQLPRNPGPWKAPNPVIAPPRIDGEPSPTLTEVNPERGSIAGGGRIWLNGIDFPALFPLFARFGTAVVPTVSLRDERCKPQLTNFLRPSPLATFLPAICPPQVCQVPSRLHYRSTPSQMRQNMEPVSRSFNI